MLAQATSTFSIAAGAHIAVPSIPVVHQPGAVPAFAPIAPNPYNTLYQFALYHLYQTTTPRNRPSSSTATPPITFHRVTVALITGLTFHIGERAVGPPALVKKKKVFTTPACKLRKQKT